MTPTESINRKPYHLARGAQELERASDAELAQVEILGLGLGLHWERLDVDLSVPGLPAGLFGTKAYMDRQRAARAGSARRPRRLPPPAATAQSGGQAGAIAPPPVGGCR